MINYLDYDIDTSPVSYYFKNIIIASVRAVRSITGYRIYFKTGLIVFLTKSYKNFYLTTEGLKSVLEKLPNDQVGNPQSFIKSHIHIRKTLKFYLKHYYLLSSTNFFGNDVLKITCDNILSNLYYIESKLRVIAYSNNNLQEDASLTSFSSNLSLSSLNHVSEL
jgi:hypothetical protein